MELIYKLFKSPKDRNVILTQRLPYNRSNIISPFPVFLLGMARSIIRCYLSPLGTLFANFFAGICAVL